MHRMWRMKYTFFTSQAVRGYTFIYIIGQTLISLSAKYSSSFMLSSSNFSW